MGLFRSATLFVCMFPSSDPFGLFPALDTKPYAFFFIVLALICEGRLSISIKAITLLLIALAGSFLVLLQTESTNAMVFLRGIYNFASVPLIYMWAWNAVPKLAHMGLILRVSVTIWFFGGVAQAFFSNLFIAPSMGRTTLERGVTAFSPEPTFYALTLLLMMFLVLEFHSWNFRKVRLELFFSGIGILFLAKSSAVLAILIPILFFWVLRRVLLADLFRGVNAAPLALMAIGVSIVILSPQFFDNSRVKNLFELLIDSDGVFSELMADASINARAQAVAFSHLGAAYNLFLPQGLHSYAEFSESMSRNLGHIFWYAGGGDKISSWTGEWVFHMGAIGVMFIAGLFFSQDNLRPAISVRRVFLLFLLVGSVPVGWPIVPILVATVDRNKALRCTKLKPLEEIGIKAAKRNQYGS